MPVRSWRYNDTALFTASLHSGRASFLSHSYYHIKYFKALYILSARVVSVEQNVHFVISIFLLGMPYSAQLLKDTILFVIEGNWKYFFSQLKINNDKTKKLTKNVLCHQCILYSALIFGYYHLFEKSVPVS